jgi:hypothetical protein
MPAIDRKSLGHPEDERREDAARVPIEHARGETTPRHVLTDLRKKERGLRAREESERRPDAEDGKSARSASGKHEGTG